LNIEFLKFRYSFCLHI